MPLGFEREPTTWRGLRAWRLGGARVQAVVCPERGARITSLLDTATGREWLVPAPLRPLRPLTYGAAWSAYEACGWDELFPTVGECAHPGPGRAAGRRLPDHGEVWSLPWEDETEAAADAAVVASVGGAALPYRLRRRAALSAAGDGLVLDYSLDNLGDADLPFQWAAHPRLAAGPEAGLASAPGWAVVADPDGPLLRFEWDRAEVPWCRVASEGEDTVVVMPATADGPSLEAAAAAGRARAVPAGGTAHWRLTATVGP